ncbi:putative ribonuclease H-like domain-containing protein [Tanacetum coccineum]
MWWGGGGGDPSNKNDSVNSTNNINTASDGNNTNNVNTVSSTVNTAGIEVNAVSSNTSIELPNDLNMPELEDIVYSDDYEDVGAEADMNNLNTFMPVSPIPTTRIHKDHPVEQIIRDLNSAPQTRRMTKNLEEHEEPKKMDVKSAFFMVRIEEEVYVCQPPGFEDPYFPDKVYKVENALFGLHQAPRACYVDDIIFGSTKKSLCTEFEKMMHKKFQMSSMGELTFFLGLQVKQKEDRIFISQEKYVTEILKKFGFTDVKTTSTPIETQKPLLKDENGKEEDVHLYRSMIGSLMYLTSSRPDIMFAVCACIDFMAVQEADCGIGVNAGDSKLMLLGINLLLLGKVNAARHNLLMLVAKTVNGEVQLQALVDGKKIVVTEASVRRDLQLEDADGVDCLPNATIFKQLTLMGSARVVSSEEESLGDQEDESKQGRIDDIDADKDIYLVNVHRDEDMFGVNDLEGDEEKAQKVEEANIAWDDIQAKVEADYQLAQRLQAQEQEELSDAEKATLFVQLLEKRREKTICSKRAEEKGTELTNKSSTKKFHVYLPEKHGWMETQRLKEQSSKKAEARDSTRNALKEESGEALEHRKL